MSNERGGSDPGIVDTAAGTRHRRLEGSASRWEQISAALKYAAPRLIGGGVLVYLILAGFGLLLTHAFAGNWLIRGDRSVSEWWFRQRTPTLNTWTHFGTLLSDTPVAIAVTGVQVVGLRLWLKRWLESVAVLSSIMGELFIFVLVTATVHRARPTVPHLDPAPPTSSFPSGHVGAAVALYVGFAVILLHATNRTGRLWPGVATVPLCLVPLIVASCRMYRGMHFLTDVIVGALAGGLWMAIVMATLLRDRTPVSTPLG